ncbi:type VII secretion protein EccE [Actinoplanes rectilineatus]|uniref:type VII secretion protein EccE n=1 Tax=Actinoplanes rectilineatus TaxID=113571 RepID=UPI001FDFC38B|nr:type VII secretion protein EccE [Actinoplanes rectilineatus]
MSGGDGYPGFAAPPVQESAPVAPPATPVPLPGADDAAVRRVRRSGHLGPVGIGQIVTAEVACLGAAAAASQGPVAGLIAGTAAAGLLGVVFARRRGRWWLEDRVIAWQHGRRRRSAPAAGGSGPLRALHAVAPGLAVRNESAPDGARVGVARDEAGWYTVVSLIPTAPVHQEAGPVPLDTLVGVLAATEQPGVVLQLVTHTVPAPGADVHPSSPAGASYRQMAQTLSPVPVPAHRESSVCVRVDAVGLAEALLDHNTDPATAAALVASLGRKVATSLRRLGIDCRVLDADDLIATLARSCDVEPGAVTETTQVREEWNRWHTARLGHRTFWLKTWPGTATAISDLLTWAAAVPAAQTSVSVVLEASGGDDVALRCLIRLATRPEDDFAALEQQFIEGVKRFGGEVEPLDGEQGPAAYATAPTGGGAG